MTFDIDSYLRQIYQNATQPRSPGEQGPPAWAPAWGYRRKKRARKNVALAGSPASRYGTAPKPATTPAKTAATGPTTGTINTPSSNTPTTGGSLDWQRQFPTGVTQLLRQLSVNAGEMGMPGGYVGGVQLPAYGSGLSPVLNPDMRTYGQQPNIGEATFFQQSMKGGMAPIAAMSPLGVPENWKPIGTTTPTKTTTK